MKQLDIQIKYNYFNPTDGMRDDFIIIRCNHKKIEVSLFRKELEGLKILNSIEEEEFSFFSNKQVNLNLFANPKYMTIKVDDCEYEEVFFEYLNYSKEEKSLDITKMFTYLKLKVMEIMKDVNLYNKYTEGIDLDGSFDGCINCIYYHKNGYCSKYNKINPPKICVFFKFRRNS